MHTTGELINFQGGDGRHDLLLSSFRSMLVQVCCECPQAAGSNTPQKQTSFAGTHDLSCRMDET